LYDSVAWRKARKAFLQENPLCIYCQQQGRTKPAVVVDHIVPHQGNEELFWNRENWQALCTQCHSGVKAREENEGVAPGCGQDGMPLDPKHPWSKYE